ncbi:MAG: flagellar protein FliT [Proteobacteria bacterium]|nr:flagellar protein FliT [Pseudomonadota bacterium]MBU4296707.1 flagellar protein FliT [Pseudomonadota bacterium]MCG2748500.1 flagellar protein FliT [Desulfobulbaceae bacterium]
MMNQRVYQESQQLITQLFDLLAEFASIQKDHAACLAENRLKNLMNWRQQREQAFRRLRQVLEQVAGLAGCDEADRQRLLNDLGKILENEKQLAGLAGAQRDRLQGSLRVMRKGKQALKGYSVYQGGSPRPKYLSNKG